tara:strand:+ start:4825 stop:7683 length:2859 start_codon:yes stop_codon:yes gene_type:complete
LEKLKLHITLLLILIWSFSYAQQYANYTTKNGLPSNHIYTILQDSKGFIWFLTDRGMVKFNGENFKNFTTKQGMPNNDIWEARITLNNKIWFLSKAANLGYIKNDSVYSFPSETEGEIFNPVFTGQAGNTIYPTGPNKSYTLKNKKWHLSFNTDSLLPLYDVIKIYGNKNVPFIQVNLKRNTLSIFGEKTNLLKKINVPNTITSLTRRKQLNDSLFVWVSTKKYSVLNLKTLKFIQYSFKDEVGLENVKHARINVVNNQIQISGTGFIGFLDKNLRIKSPFYFPKNIKSHFAIIDKTNTIWLATFSNGVYKLPYVKRNLSYQLANNKIGKFSIIKNQLYTSIFNKGYYKLNDTTQNFELFLTVDEYPFKPIEIKEFETSYFPSKYKLSILKKGKLTTIDFLNKPAKINNRGFQFIKLNDKLYSIFSFGVNQLNKENLTIEKEFLQSGCNQLFTFKNKLFIATSSGLKLLQNDSIQHVNFSTVPFNKPILNIRQLTEDKLILNTDGFGSYITNLKTIAQLPQTNFMTVEDACIEKNTLWLATNEGILKYHMASNSYKLLEKITMSNGLPSNNITDITIHNNNLVVSTNNGIVIIPKNQKHISQFLDIYFEKATYNNKAITYNSKFEYTKNNTTNFYISSIDFSEGNSTLNYKYRLLPIQKKWINSSSNNLNFNNLSPKKYILEINSNNIAKTYKFKITPLWWQRTISQIIFSLLAITIIILVLLKIRNSELAKKTAKLNIQKQLAVYELHALRSQMNPHFVFNSLNSIQYYITKNEIELSEKYLVKFSRLIRKFFDFSRDKFISLDQEISLLNNYLEIEKMRFGTEFNYEFNLDKTLNLSEQKIPSMLLQPIVENAVNHGLFHNEGNGLITINFKKEANTDYVIEIIDNGIGLKKSQEIKENSIKKHLSKSSEIIKNRIELLNKSKEWYITYSIKELKNTTGTIVQLTFKKNE